MNQKCSFNDDCFPLVNFMTSHNLGRLHCQRFFGKCSESSESLNIVKPVTDEARIGGVHLENGIFGGNIWCKML